MSTNSTPRDANPPDPIDRSATCEECGAFGAVAVGDRWLCERCYSEKGSCCPEFGKDDLWANRDDAPKQP